MNIFGFKLSRKDQRAKERKGLTAAISSALSEFFGGRAVSAKGETVVLEQNSVVVVALRWIMDSITSGDVVTQRYAGTRYQTVVGHPLTKLLRRPSRSMTGDQRDQALAASLVLDGNAYEFKVRTGNGRVTELQFLPHFAVEPKANEEGELSHYEYRTSKGVVRLEARDVIHAKRGIDPNNKLKGFSALKGVIEEVVSDNEATTYTMSILRNFGVAGFIVSPDGDYSIDEEQASIIKQRVKDATIAKNRGEPIVMSGGIKISTTGYSPEQLNLDRIRVIPEARIIGAIGVPAMALGLTSGEDVKTFSNYGEALKSAYRHCLKHLWRAIDSATAEGLLSEFGEDPDTWRVARDLSEVEDLAEAVSDRMIAEYQANVRKRSEVRQELNLDVTPEDEVYFMDAAAAGLNTADAKSWVKADILGKRRERELREAA